ncbi:hypothetical protein BSKO_13427 [Bryopsis sp. KO-2023]|nr:hypothetical protein BSKO_13427 [Bryopsis sp. KO-2023]
MLVEPVSSDGEEKGSTQNERHIFRRTSKFLEGKKKTERKTGTSLFLESVPFRFVKNKHARKENPRQGKMTCALLGFREIVTAKKSSFDRAPRKKFRRGCSIVCEAAHNKAKVKLTIPFETKFGQSMCVAGAAEELGSWKEDSCLVMNWEEGNVWTADCQLPTGAEIEYKYILKNVDGSLEWQPGPNVKLEVPVETGGETPIAVHDCWTGGDQKVSIGDRAISQGSRQKNKKNRANVELPELPTEIVATGPVDIGAPEDVGNNVAANGLYFEQQETFAEPEASANLNGSSPFAERM